MRYAIVEDSVVVNIVIADGAAHDYWIECGTAGIGWAYANGVFTAPEPAVSAPAARAPISKREFLKLFTPTEYAGIKTAATANAQVDYYWQQFLLADFISLDDPDTVGGLQMLEGAGLLAAGRAAEIVK